jgi:tetratricopeptide (TPR) repeat protein
MAARCARGPRRLAYRASKFVRRNKVAVAASIVVCLGASVAATAYVAQARREAAHFRDLRKLANLFMFKYHDGIAALPGSTELRKELVKDALDYLNSLTGKGNDDPGLLREIASAYQRIADVQGGGTSSAKTGGTLSAANLGDTAGALENYGKALEIREELAQLQPDDRTAQFELAETYASLGDVAAVLGRAGETAEYFRRSIAISRALLEKEPHDKSLRALLRTRYFALASPLALHASNLGDTEGALAALRAGSALAEALVVDEPQNPAFRQSLGVGYGDTGRLLFNEGRVAEALAYYQKALALGKPWCRENAANPLYRRELAVQHRNLGAALLETGGKAGSLSALPHGGLALRAAFER